MSTDVTAHPDDPDTLVVATSTGLYLSRNSAAIFSPLTAGQNIFAATIEPSGAAVWYSLYRKGAKLLVKSLPPNASEREVRLPAMHGDAVAFIAFNPVVKQEMAIATKRRNVFISRNSGKDWIQIVHEGDPNG